MMREVLLCLFSIFTITVNANTLQQALDAARINNKVSAMQMTLILSTQEHITLTSGTVEQDPKSAGILPDTLFQIGSNTKSYTAALLLKLVEEKKLKISDTIEKFFPQYQNWANVTLSQLLHNNSGIPSYSENKSFQEQLAANPKRVWTSEELVAIAYKLPLTFQRGQGWHYSNTNFILAGMIAEKVTIKSLNELYQTYFFTPLKLNHSYYLPTIYSEEILKQMAHGYDGQRDVTFDNMSWANAAGAIISNSNDLANWAYALFHNKVLSKDSMQQMLSLVSTKTGLNEDNPKEGYGMGIGMRINDKYGKWYGHEGETLGFHAIFMWFPQSDLTLAILANGDANQLRQFAETLPGLVG